MRRVHFDIQTGDEVIADEEGEMLPDVDAARIEATASAREALANYFKSGGAPPDRIQVTDDDGKDVLSIALADLLPKLRR